MRRNEKIRERILCVLRRICNIDNILGIYTNKEREWERGRESLRQTKKERQRKTRDWERESKR